jgi:hypothetical protein
LDSHDGAHSADHEISGLAERPTGMYYSFFNHSARGLARLE